MKIAAGLFLFLGLTTPVAAECHDTSVRIVEEKQGGVIHFYAESDNLLDFTITLDLQLENLQASPALPVTVDVKGGNRAELASIRVVDPQKPTHYTRDYSWRYGARGGVPARVAYLLPYAAGEQHELKQGYLGDFSHNPGSQNEYAYDFAMPVGTVVCAARDGVVVGVRQGSDVGGPTPAFRNCGNYVIIRHRDGTYAEYVHLKKNGALVALGSDVRAGQPIAISGATGFTSGPHLHFAVFRVLDGYKRETLPVFMKTRDGLRAHLTEGRDY
ncbi:MAG TPA: M23 family metallopeptidase [Opitutaceae bacterium]|nr:M23 family metallopeptidase [Opitutaceae bacterium]